MPKIDQPQNQQQKPCTEKASDGESEEPQKSDPATSNPSDRRNEKLALSLLDLDKADKSLVARILGGKLAKEVVTIDNTEVGVTFTCSLETAALAIDVLRSENRREGLQPVRAYIFRGDWKRLPVTAVLTVQNKGAIVLNPLFFPRVVSEKEAVPLERKPFKFGGKT